MENIKSFEEFHSNENSNKIDEAKNDFMVTSPNKADFLLRGIKDEDIRDDVGERMFIEAMSIIEKIAADNNLNVKKVVINVK